MQPSPAEVARTLAAGGLPGRVHLACRPGPVPVRHASDPAGRLLLLVPEAGTLHAALRPAADGLDAAVAVEVADVPPTADAPSLGRVWVGGWATPLDGPAARAAALDFAAVDPVGDLLDVGRGWALHRVEIAEVRLERAGVTIDVDPDEYAAAVADPLHPMEFALVADLADHHAERLADYVRRQLGPAARPDDEPRVVRLDRYGFVVRLADRLARLAFPRPVGSRAELARLLHPVLCGRCG